VYDAYDFDENWNGPRNRLLANTHFDILCCPAEGQFVHASTSYFAVVGPGTAWPGAEGSKLSEFKDGPENTILLVEVVGAGIGWAEPRDLHVTQMSFLINQNHGQGMCSNHPHGLNVLFADDHVEFLPETITPEELRALLTINGGEKIGSR
jgi:prepilin-type processing-associated H-X9-DG protein